MAKYSINYICGHGSTVKDLVGKTSERERKIALMEASLVCPNCYKAEQAIKDYQAQKIAYVDVVSAPIPTLQVTLTGQIKLNQDALKQLGYSWMEAAGGFSGYISMNKPELRLGKYSKQTFVLYELLAFIRTCRIELNALGYKLVNNLSDIDMGLLKKQIADRQQQELEKQKRLQADPKPKNTCYQFMFDRHGSRLNGWNGKIYGSSRHGYCYYYYKEKIAITPEQQKAIAQYQADYTAWKQRNKDIL